MLRSPGTMQIVLETEFIVWMARDTVPTLSAVTVKYGVRACVCVCVCVCAFARLFFHFY